MEGYRWDYIDRALKTPPILEKIVRGEVPDEYGIGLDERCVEYAWCLSSLTKIDGKVLDAGSALNYRQIINAVNSAERKLTIAGLAVEKNCYYAESVSYQLCDLRNLPFRDNWFDVSLSISTLEHVGMDNAIYGHDNSDDSPATASGPVRDGYIAALREIYRVTTSDGIMILIGAAHCRAVACFKSKGCT